MNTIDPKGTYYFGEWNSLFFSILHTDSIVESESVFTDTVTNLLNRFGVYKTPGWVSSLYNGLRNGKDYYIRITHFFGDMEAGKSELYRLEDIAFEYKYTYNKVFSIRDVRHINSIMNTGDIRPDYTPRKINRVLESNNDINTAHEIGIETLDIDQFTHLESVSEELGYKVGHLPKGFPHYVFFDLRNKTSSFIDYMSTKYLHMEETDPNYCLDGVYKKIFTIPRDMEIIRRTLKEGKIIDIPTYKPRRMSRLDEAYERYEYFRVVFVANDQRESEKLQRDLFRLGYKWRSSGQKLIDFKPREFPMYFFTSDMRFDKYMTHLDAHSYTLREKTIEEYIDHLNTQEEYICPKVFPYDKVDMMDNILRTGTSGPDYRPRRIERLTESVDGKYLPIVVECNTKKDCHEFEEYIHTLGYKYNGDREYVLRDIFGELNRVVFFEIDKKNKRTNLGNRRSIDYNTDIILTYPEDKRTIDSYLKDKPSYEPRKVLRESLNPKYEYSIIIGFKSDEYEELLNLMVGFYKKHDMDTEYVKDFFHRISGDLYRTGTYIRILDNNRLRYGSLYTLDDNATENEFEYEKVLELEDIRNGVLDNVVKYGTLEGIRKPDYSPKKIIRTFEEHSEYPYRFKTEKEMREEYGYYWKTSNAFGDIGWSDVEEDGSSAMDRYLGKVLPFTADQFNSRLSGKALPERYEGWSIHWNMLTSNKPIVPNYLPRRIIKESVSEDLRYERYKREMDKGNIWLYVRTSNGVQARNFYDSLQRYDNLSFDFGKDSIYAWERNHSESEDSFFFGFRPNYRKMFDVSCIKNSHNLLEKYPEWVMDISDRDLIRRLFGVEEKPSYRPKKINRDI